MPTKKRPHEILEISPGASQDEIRAAYRALAKKHHPNANPDDPEAHERFVELKQAHDDMLEALSAPEDPFDHFVRNPFGGSGFQFRMNHQMSVEATLKHAYDGFETEIEVSGRKISVRWPPGSYHGMRNPIDINSSLSLTLVLSIRRDRTFKFINRLDLAMTTRVDVLDLMRGATIAVPSLKGDCAVPIDPWTSPGSTIRIPGYGYRTGIETGDLFVTVEALLPGRDSDSAAAMMDIATDLLDNCTMDDLEE
jgi:DnaJ-class molecular chaperone